jgi:hypothetical protein
VVVVVARGFDVDVAVGARLVGGTGLAFCDLADPPLHAVPALQAVITSAPTSTNARRTQGRLRGLAPV